MTQLVGRQPYKKIMYRLIDSGDPELLAVYGRRRIGKTFLIRTHFGPLMRFEMTGSYGASLADQLSNFATALVTSKLALIEPETPKSWQAAFQQLIVLLEQS